MTSATPARIGRFQIVEELGRGAMGVVYKALDPALDRTVAIKTILLSGDLAERANFEARFVQEAKAAGRLSHPAIITVHDVGREGDLAYMAMELLAGDELRTKMAQAQLPAREAIGIAAQVAEGLAFAHEHGVVHRDIKPANIMVMRSGRVKIMDFGIARMQLSDVKTQTGVLLGTPKYMSPEQVAGRALDHRTDIFSLGAVLYEMLIGRAPFSGSDTAHLMYNIASTAHITPSRIASGLPAVLDLIVARALEKDPGARYQSAQEFAADLHACAMELVDAPKVRTVRGAEDATLALERTQELDAGGSTRIEPAPGPEISRATAPGSRTGRLTDQTGTAAATRFWPLSRRFDSSIAFQRLATPDSGSPDAAAPQPPGGMLRALRDRDLRRLIVAIGLATMVGAAIVLA